MSEFAGLKKGDLVRLVVPDTDEQATIVVDFVNYNGTTVTGTRKNMYNVSVGWRLDNVLKTATKPLPTEPGIYGPRGKDGFGPYKLLVLTKHGEWFWLDITARPKPTVFQAIPADEVEEWADTIEPIAVRNK